jgi:hypothetical protein
MTAPLRHQARGRVGLGPAVPGEGEPAAGTVPARAWTVTVPRIAGIGPFTIRGRAA